MRSAEERRRDKAEALGRRPAFPRKADAGSDYNAEPGMTLIEWFAGQALAGRLVLPLPVNVVKMEDGECVTVNYDATENIDEKVDRQLAVRMFSIAEKMVEEALRRREGG